MPADNLKRLDLGVYYGLRAAISKRAYRFLDKRFYVREDWTFDLRELGFAHPGLSGGYSEAKLREKLRPAWEELIGIGFLGSATYASPGRGRWTVWVVRVVADRRGMG